jgi:hypothetical protein
VTLASNAVYRKAVCLGWYVRLSGVRLEEPFDLHRLVIFVHLALRFNLLPHLALDHVWIAYLGDRAVVLHEHRVSALVDASGVAGGMPGSLGDASGIAYPATHFLGWVVLGIEQDQGTQNDREKYGSSFHVMYLANGVG